MPTAQGSIQFVDSRLVGSFDVDGSPRYLAVDVKPLHQSFKCEKATLTYSNVGQLSGHCKWTGTAGRDDLQMDFAEGITITGRLTAPRSSVRIRGAGAWSALEMASAPSSTPSVDGLHGNGSNITIDQSPPLDVAQDSAKIARENALLKSGIPIIAIFGQSGAGKSTFINLVASEKQKVGRGLQSCTSEISVIEAKIRGTPVLVIDTPGIDDTHGRGKNADVLIRIADRLRFMREQHVLVNGVLFLHRISDIRFSQTAKRISNVLQNLCGDAAMSHLMLCTTMWDKVPEDEGNNRLDELCESGAWKEMMEKGAGTAMISSMSPNAKAEAEGILSQLIKNTQPVELALQNESVRQSLHVEDTDVGMILGEHFRGVQATVERKRLHDKSEASAAKIKEEMHAQGLEITRLKKLGEAQAREHQAQAEHLQQEQEKAKRERKELREQMRKNSEAITTHTQDELRMRQKEVAFLKQHTEAMDRAEQSYPEALKREQEKAEQEMKRLQDIGRKQQEEMRIRILQAAELKKQETALADARKVAVKQLRRERKNAERTMKELRARTRRLAVAESAKAREARLSQLRDVKRRAAADKPPMSFWNLYRAKFLESLVS